MISAGRGFFFARRGEGSCERPYRLEPCARLYLYGHAAYGAGYVKHHMTKIPLYVTWGGVPKQNSAIIHEV